MKKHGTLILKSVISLCVALLLVPTTSIAANPKVYVNNNLLATDAIIYNDMTYVPLRAVSEAAGAEVRWDGNTDSAYVDFMNNDAIISNIISRISPSVVAIIGNYKPGYLPGYMEKYNERTAHGTGVIIKSGGEILTNAHVVNQIENITVVLHDGGTYNARIKCIDEKSDLAVIKIDKIGLPIIKMGNMEDVVTGKTVIAIGTPVSFSLMNSASVGIVSGINRGIDSDYRLIQTDAAINPGNSGGPLVNIKGELIGINSSKYAGVGIESLGFSIPVNTVQYVLSQFDNHGKVIRPSVEAVFEESWKARLGLPNRDGLTISRIDSSSPLTDAGITSSDVIMSVNGTQVNSLIDWNEEMKNYIPGNAITLQIKRGEDLFEKDIVLK
ncbi:serine protease family s1c htra-related [Holotrichia oblita]|nr:serine protease family s1c htra-related [Holotrichia oblita]